MSLHETPEHRRRNDAQIALTKRSRPDLWARILGALTPEQRAETERRAARAETEGGAQ